MKLEDVAEGDSPFGRVNAADPTDYARVGMVAFVLLGGLAIGRFAFNQAKSVTGASDMDLGVEGVLN